MKKIKFFIIFLLASYVSVKANPVDATIALKTAQNFYLANHTSGFSDITLAYTERDASGVPVYYVFNVNAPAPGFIIVSAEDATHPVIGYSDESAFAMPVSNNNVSFWLQKRKNEIIAIRAHNIAATSDIMAEWVSYSTNNAKQPTHAASNKVVGPLCKTTWNQEPYYNAMCPGGSVTGCVATAMAQIMRYWEYPNVGFGSNCYEDEQSHGYSENYGQLCAEFDTTHYMWSAMPGNLTNNNDQVAELMYDCGVSVDMDYTPTGSGAQVMGGYGSAFNAYTTYFGYDTNTINTQYYNGYDSSWIALIENELNNHRPVQFQGFDPIEGGHSWVCDGYNTANVMMHMNWGWGGQDNGWYLLDALNPFPLDFSDDIGVVYGIQPPPAALGVKQITNPLTVNVYPNPSKGIFNFTIPNNSNSSYQLTIYNPLGQQVNASVITTETSQINLSTQPKGVYIYRITTETGSPISTGRLVIE